MATIKLFAKRHDQNFNVQSCILFDVIATNSPVLTSIMDIDILGPQPGGSQEVPNLNRNVCKRQRPNLKLNSGEIKNERQKLTLENVFICTPSVSKQKLRFTKYVGLRSIFAFLAQNHVRCIALIKRFRVS